MYNKCIFMYIYIVIFIAHELRAWFIHHSPPVLHNILPNDCYQHYLLLVEGIYLLKSEVTETDLHQSLRLLQHCCFLFASFYGKIMSVIINFTTIIHLRNMSINVHSLLYHADVVHKLGPLWAHSCFPFESFNGDLHFFHESESLEKQV